MRLNDEFFSVSEGLTLMRVMLQPDETFSSKIRTFRFEMKFISPLSSAMYNFFHADDHQTTSLP